MMGVRSRTRIGLGLIQITGSEVPHSIETYYAFVIYARDVSNFGALSHCIHLELIIDIEVAKDNMRLWA